MSNQRPPVNQPVIHSSPSIDNNLPKPQEDLRGNRIVGLFLFMLLIGIIYIYSFEGEIRMTTTDMLNEKGFI